MKKFTAIILSVLMAALAFSSCSAKPETKGSAESESKSEAVEATTEAVTEATTAEKVTEELTTEKTEELTSEATTEAKPDYSFLQSGVWYLYNDDEKTAYAFEFTSDSKVDVSYFDSNNTQGLDAKYSTESENYTVNVVEGETILELADPVNRNESFMFTLKKNAVYFGKEKLASEKEVSLDLVFSHFND